jgi:hypothetical protein
LEIFFSTTRQDVINILMTNNGSVCFDEVLEAITSSEKQQQIQQLFKKDPYFQIFYIFISFQELSLTIQNLKEYF